MGVPPAPWLTFFDDLGAPVAGGKLYMYLSGTTTPLAVYDDVDLLVPLSNPVILDSAGRVSMYIAESSYKYVLRDRNDALIRTEDNVPSLEEGSVGGTGEEFVFMGDPTSQITGTSYPSGSTYDKLHAGTAIMNMDSGLLEGTYRVEAMALAGGGATVSVALMNLSDGAPDTPIGTAATTTSTTGARIETGDLTFGAIGSLKNYGIKVKVSTGFGFAWGIRLKRMP